MSRFHLSSLPLPMRRADQSVSVRARHGIPARSFLLPSTVGLTTAEGPVGSELGQAYDSKRGPVAQSRENRLGPARP